MAAVAVAVLLSAGGHAGQTVEPPTSEDLDIWHAQVTDMARSSTPGCFNVTYPGLVPREVPCGAPPSTPMTPRAPGPVPTDMGNGNSVMVRSGNQGSFAQATGSFDRVVNVATVTSVIPNQETTDPLPGAYTLQLNTNHFDTPLCAQADNPAICRGWQQFVYANDGDSGEVYIEYWLLDYNEDDCGDDCRSHCPAGWQPYAVDELKTACRIVGDSNHNGVPAVPIANLAAFRLTGDVSGNSHIATFQNGTDASFAISDPILEPGNQWTDAEFNVFGYGNGRRADLNNGAIFDVRTLIRDGTTNEPECLATGYTAETNNLHFAFPRPERRSPGPAMIVHEERLNVRDPFQMGRQVANCNAAVLVGDTHQQTFAGLLYDFQASGDFVEARVGSAFEVQSRKMPAPSSPNTSLNRSVATRMGSTRVALCDTTDLMVNGGLTTLAPDGSLSLPTGVDIHRVGTDLYFIRDRAGNSVSVAVRNGYIDVQVGVGKWPTAVRGLLGNPDDDPNQLEARDGRRFSRPFEFDDLYNKFGASWRVSPLSTLLAPCDPVTVGNPAQPLFASGLPAHVRDPARLSCDLAGVSDAWLDACTLDVAVLGSRGLPVFLGLEDPVATGDFIPPPPPPPCPHPRPGPCP